MRKVNKNITSIVLGLILLLKSTPALAVTNQFGKYDPMNYNSIFVEGNWTHFISNSFSETLNSLVNSIFGINKVFYVGFDMVIKYAMQDKLFNSLADGIGGIANKMYHNLFGTLGLFLVVLVIIMCAITFTFSSPEQAVKQFFMVIVVMTCSLVWFQQSSYFMKVLNGWSVELQSEISSAGSISGDKLTSDKNGDSLQNASDNIRSSFFSMSIEEPYYLMNYGSVDTKTIEKRTQDGKDITEFIPKNAKDNEAEKNISEAKPDKNEYLASSNLAMKFAVAVVSGLITTFFGIIEVIITLLNVVLQFLVLLIDLILPLLAILSILPRFRNMFVGGVKAMILVLMGKASVGLLLLAFRMILIGADKIIPRTNLALFLGNYFFKIGIIGVLWLFRKPIGVLMSTAVGEFKAKVSNELPTAGKDTVKNVALATRDSAGNIGGLVAPELMASTGNSMGNALDILKGDKPLISRNTDDTEKLPEVDEHEETYESPELQSTDTVDDTKLSETTVPDVNVDNDVEIPETALNNEVDIDNPETFKNDVLVEGADVNNDFDESNVIHMEEYQNLTASGYSSDENKISMDNALLPTEHDTLNFQNELKTLKERK